MDFFDDEKSAIPHLDLCAKYLKKVETWSGFACLVQTLLRNDHARIELVMFENKIISMHHKSWDFKSDAGNFRHEN